MASEDLKHIRTRRTKHTLLQRSSTTNHSTSEHGSSQSNSTNASSKISKNSLPSTLLHNLPSPLTGDRFLLGVLHFFIAAFLRWLMYFLVASISSADRFIVTLFSSSSAAGSSSNSTCS